MTAARFSTSHLTRRFFLTTAAASAVTAVAGCMPDIPVTLSPGSAANLEFGLWAGVPGARFGQAVNRAVGPRRIRAPRSWTHPITGKRLTIHVRTKWERTGTKASSYAMRADGTGLARVFDSRPGKPPPVKDRKPPRAGRGAQAIATSSIANVRSRPASG
ncbi:MAG: hypothetical protein CVT70_06210 [Alphaproteobacteria bacterium HGW-Alphaproteobacteria-1]|nr:MAG: hypothetical protein CVT70_06210 [Alphaproteobacteria bacterium HGW-Alphaproteobacteria-1]